METHMYSLDCETTGLWFTHGCQTFAIGVYNGTDFASAINSVSPFTRKRYCGFDDDVKTLVREAFASELVCMHNSIFDVKALVEAEVFDAEEPTVPEFWERIIDTTILSHLNHNTDKRSLKDLSPQYLDVAYESEDELNTIVNKCRQFVRTRRPDWQIASRKVESLRPASSTPKWHKADMWLPATVAATFSEKELKDYGFNVDKLKTILEEYLKDDCVNTYDLAQCMMKSVIEEHGEDVMKYLAVNNQILHVVYKMETQGTGVHKKELDDAISVCEHWIEKLTKETEDIAGVTGITDTKLRKILFEDMQLPAYKETKSGAASVDADTILNLKRSFKSDPSIPDSVKEFVTKIMALKKYDKKLGYLITYRDSMIDGRVHTSYNIVGTDTLRVTAKNPALQTVTKTNSPFDNEFDDITKLLEQSPHLRSVFGPESGRWWLCCDYSQLQLRIFAVVTGEQDMIEAFNKGYDAHDYTARRIFGLKDSEKPSTGQRRIAKNVNFGFIFGASPKKIETASGMVGLWDTVCALFPNAHDFIQYQKELLKAGNPVRTLGNYPLDVPMKEVKWKATEERAAHAAVCYIVQGSEGIIVKRAMRLCDDYLVNNYPEGRLVLQVHDEIDFDMPAKFPKKHAIAIKQCMEDAATYYGVTAPVECELCTHGWNISKKIKL